MTPLYVELLLHAYCRGDVFPRRGAPAVEDAIIDLVARGAIEFCDEPNMIRATPMGTAWVKLICRTPAPTQAWIDAERRVIE